VEWPDRIETAARIQLLADSGGVTMAAKAIGTTSSAMYSLRRSPSSSS